MTKDNTNVEKRRIEKALLFGATYGGGAYSMRPVSQNELMNQQVRKHWLYLVKTNNRLAVYNVKDLRKAKARYMLYALKNGVSEEGNHFMTCFGDIFHFFYRGTVIYKWDAVKDIGEEIDAGKYQFTDSTRNQRNEIKKAIAQFNAVVFTE